MRFTVLLLVALLAGCGGGNKTLTRAKAQEILAKSEFLKTPRTYPFILSKERPDNSFVWNLTLFPGNERNGYLAMEAEGYLTIEKGRFGGASVDTELTAKGRDAIANQNWKKGPAGAWRSGLWVPVATPEIIAITGLVPGAGVPAEVNPGGNLTGAEFTWKWTLTPIGQKLAARELSFAGSGLMPWDFDPAKVSNGNAVFQLYDDGWRVVDISPELKEARR